MLPRVLLSVSAAQVGVERKLSELKFLLPPSGQILKKKMTRDNCLLGSTGF